MNIVSACVVLISLIVALFHNKYLYKTLVII